MRLQRCACVFILMAAIATLLPGSRLSAQTRELEQAFQAWRRHTDNGEYQLALPHAQRLLSYARSNSKFGSEQLTEAIYRVADLQHFIGDYDKADLLYGEALKNARAMAPRNMHLLARVLSGYGDLRRLMGRYREGEALLLEAITAYEAVVPIDYEGLANGYSNLGICQKYLGKFSQAEASYKKAIAIIVGRTGPEAPELVTKYMNFARLYEDEGKLQEALAQLQSALSILKLHRNAYEDGLAHLFTGRILVGLGRTSEAISHLEISVGSLKQALGADAPLYREAWALLSDTRRSAVSAAGQIALLQKQIVDAKRRYGAQSYQALDLQFQVALAQRKNGSKQDARSTLLELKRTIDAAGIRNLSGQVSRYLGDFSLEDNELQTALEYFQDAAESYVRAGDGYQLYAGQAFERLGTTLYRLGDHDASVTANRKGIEILMRSGHDRDPSSATALINLANGLPDFDPQKLQIYETSVARIIAHVGPKDSGAYAILQFYGHLLSKWGRYEDAISIYEKVMSVSEEMSGDRSASGKALFASNILRAAMDGNLLEVARNYADILKKSVEGRDEGDIPLLLTLANYYIANGDKEEAHKVVARAQALAVNDWYRRQIDRTQAQLLLATRRFDKALEMFSKLAADKDNERGSYDVELAEAYLGLGDVANARLKASEASKLLVEDLKHGSERLPLGDLIARSQRTHRALAALSKALYSLWQHQGQQQEGILEVAFETAQWRSLSLASASLSQFSSRLASGSDALGLKIRAVQDRLTIKRSLEAKLIESVQKFNTPRDNDDVRQFEAAIDREEGEIDRLEKEITSTYKDYARSTQPLVLSLSDARRLLKSEGGRDEALILIDTVDSDTFIWLVTLQDVRWLRAPLGSSEIAEHVAALRCGLDATLWQDASNWPDTTDAQVRERNAQMARRQRCERSVKGKPATELVGLVAAERLPFDVARSHALFDALLGPLKTVIAGKRLLIVPSGSLGSLPFQVLVTEPAKAAVPSTFAEYRDVAWLGTRQATTVVPSVASLKALREFAKASHATKVYLGIGNPLLDGPQDDVRWGPYYKRQAELARTKRCSAPSIPGRIASARGPNLMRGFESVFRGAHADIENVRVWRPLPETADELCDVALRLGVPDSEILIGGSATETKLKDLSERGKLADYGIVHFATHGVIAGQVAGSSEPGLILTPPAKGTSDAKALERDDGFLTASEIATLKLDADWIILSACNTAAGAGGSADALSGLARAFFYAGARALLVSHWEVDSGAAVKLTTRAFAALQSNPAVGRAEAFRMSMRELIETGSASDAHPAMWAPFVVVGEGAR